jgi:hypothetical protein
LLVALLALLFAAPALAASPLPTALDYRIVGAQLRPARTSIDIPKNVPGALTVSVVAGDGTQNDATRTIAANAIVEATLRGPSFPARRVVGTPGGDLELPPLPLVGDYSLDDIRLLDSTTGAVRLEGTPRSVPIRVFDEVLVSRVTSRALSLEEIQEKGIVLDEKNFRAVEFEVGFVVDGQTVPVRFPVIAPRFNESTELIPRAELDELLAKADAANVELGLGVTLPQRLVATGLDLEIKGINFQFVEPVESDGLGLAVPPIPGLLVIPGKIGLLNQFFSVQLFTENAAPAGSGLSVHDIVATLALPPGPDQRAGTFDAPGDDPLRFARVGPNATIQPIQPVRAAGPDGQPGTSDDIGRLQPGDTGQAEFLVEGLAEGLHLMDITIDGVLDGLGGRERRVRGVASGSVLVRNPKFSLAFGHPRTIRNGEPYAASVTVLNTSTTPANLVSVRLPSTSLSGAAFEAGQAETVEIGTILPGETKIASFRLRAQRTGSITFSQFTSDGDIVGRFQLRMGVDERGVELSPDAIGYPDFVNDLTRAAPDVFAALDRYLGQALSVATAAQLPPGVERVSRGILKQRVVEIAEAGQRLRYGDTAVHVFSDLLLDLQGARASSPGLDQILRETDAGRELREALFRTLQQASGRSATELLAERADDLAGRGEPWLLASTRPSEVVPSLELNGKRAELGKSFVQGAAGYAGLGQAGGAGHWIVSKPEDGTALRFDVTSATAVAEISVLALGGDGRGRLLRWTVQAPAAGACFRHAAGSEPPLLDVDETCDGVVDRSLVAAVQNVQERAPQILSIVQDTDVITGRPNPPCSGTYGNYGTTVAVLFSKPMSQASVNAPAAFLLDDGSRGSAVQIQPGGRVALVNLARGIGTFRTRTLTVAPGVTDPRGNPLVVSTLPIHTTAADGVAIQGRVVKGNGEPAAGIPVTLTMYDSISTGISCSPFTVRAAQMTSGPDGSFSFDFVLAGIPYSISATDTSGLSAATANAIVAASSDTGVDRGQLLELAQREDLRDSLLASFAAGALPEAVASAEGLDRALLRDFVEVGSSRIGSEVPVALRFRGRGSVTGTVFLADGTTPVSGATVNLFPDPDSRELGRGVFSDANGRFAFLGVPLGSFTIEATSAAGRTRTIAGNLAAPGDSRELSVVLSTTIVERSAIEGRVLEGGSTNGHAAARVFVGKFVDGRFTNVVAAVTADEDGAFRADSVPVGTWDLVAASLDGRRRGERTDVASTAGVVNRVTITLQGRGTVRGRVEFANGQPVANALVGGGEALVRTDANGFFTLTGVPAGQQTIEAGLEKDLAAGIEFTRIGSGVLDVVPGVQGFVTVRLKPAGRILGRVFDAAGTPVPNVRVSIPRPQENGFLWTQTDATGSYLFENLGLDDYTVSAPGPAVADTNVDPILDALKGSPSQEQLEAALTKTFEIFTGKNDPLLNGEGTRFSPLDWGFSKTALRFDGQSALVNVQFLPRGTVAGTVLNGQGVPIGAKVRLTGVGPTPVGDVGFVVRGDANSDPALGTFEFKDQLLAGDFGVQSATPFFPATISIQGRTTRIELDARNLVLQYPSEALVNGRLAGTVEGPDGNLVGAGVRVKIDFGDLEIRTDANGRFDTQIDLPALTPDGRRRGYAIAAEDPVTGLRGQALATLTPGMTTEARVRLLGRGSLTIQVRDALGAPAANADVTVSQATFPQGRFTGRTDVHGKLQLEGLFEGFYGVTARVVVGPTEILGSAGVAVPQNGAADVLVRLGATGTVRGRFLAADRSTPIANAQVSLGGLGFAATDTSGAFLVEGMPLGTLNIFATDPVNGRLGLATATLSQAGQVVDVLIVERATGEITGAVISSFGNAFVSGATVELQPLDGISPVRTATTDPGGFFSFPGVPAGPIQLRATDPVSKLQGSVTVTLGEGVLRLAVDVPLQSLTSVVVHVLESDGVTPASDASVTLSLGGSRAGDTDADGNVRFGELPLGNYVIGAVSRIAGRTRSVAQKRSSLTTQGASPDVTIVLGGVGRVTGRVLASDGQTRLAGRQVTLSIETDLLRETLAGASDTAGEFAFEGVPIGAFRLVATDVALAASESGTIQSEGNAPSIDLVLGPSGTVLGRLLGADGTTVVAAVDVTLFYAAPSGALGRASVRSAADGAFRFESVPAGRVFLEALVPARNGIARRSLDITSNGQVLDLGAVLLDEADPRVVAVVPFPGSDGVATDVSVHLVFDEALDPDLIDPRGIFLRNANGPVDAEVTLVTEPQSGELRIVEIRPRSPLPSETDHQVIVIDGELRDALGAVIGQGPRDLVGRPLTAPFSYAFRTRDQDPPGLLSLTPATLSTQNDPRSVVRVSFDEPLSSTGAVIELTGPKGAVAGRVDVGVGGRVLVFTPSELLDPNGTYTARVRNVRDVAGNLAESDPACAPDLFCTTFATLDTLGPAIAGLALADGALPVANATVRVVATLAQPEPGVRVRLSADLVPVAESLSDVVTIPFTLPPSGSIVLRAVAIDRFGNEGPIIELPVTVLANQPPTVSFRRINPETGPAPTGTNVVVEVTGSDDAGLRELKAAASGAFVRPLVTSAGPSLLISGVVPAETPAGRSVRILAQAIDNSGASSGEQAFEIPISDATPPSVATISPPAGTRVRPGEAFEVVVRGRDAFGASRLTLETSGALVLSTAQVVEPPASEALRSFQVAVPAGTPADAEIVLVASAQDAAGNTRAAAPVTVRVADVVPPQVVLVDPPAGTDGTALRPTLRVLFSEPIAAGTLNAVSVVLLPASGVAVPLTLSLSTDGLTLSARPESLLAPETKHTLSLAGLITDLAGNALAGTTSDFKTGKADTTRPRLIALEPVDGTLDASARPHLRATFDEPVDRASFGADGLALARLDASGAETKVSTALGFESDDHVALLELASDLEAGARYALTLAGTVTDLSGNGVTDAAGVPLAAGKRNVFSVGGFALTSPAAGTRTVEGQTLTLAAVAAPSLGVDTVTFTTNGVEVATDASAPFTATLTVPGLAAIGGDPALRVGARGLVAGVARFVAPEITIEVNAASADADGDGLTNGQELAAGTDPFRADATEDPDGDGLTNAEEIALGTAVGAADTDGDGLSDFEEVRHTGTNPRNADTDGDGIPDGLDLASGPRLVFTDPADGATNVSVRPLVRVSFDEPLDPPSATAARVRLLDPAAGIVPTTLALADGGHTLELRPDTALAFETLYTLSLASGLTDDTGKPATENDGSALHDRTFATGSFAITAPASGDAVLERSQVPVSASGSAALGIASVEFLVNGTLTNTDAEAPFGFTLDVPPIATGSTLTLTAVARDASNTELARARLTLDVVVGLRAERRLLGVALGGTGTLRLLLRAPQTIDLPVAIEVVDPAVVAVPIGPFVLRAGETLLTIPLTGLVEGGTTVVARSDRDVVPVHVSVTPANTVPVFETKPAPDETPPVIADANGVAVQPLPSAGFALLSPFKSATLSARFLASPAPASVAVTASTSNAAVATVRDGARIEAGSTDLRFTVDAAGEGDAVFTLRTGAEGREFRVHVGTPIASATLPTVAAPVGIAILPLPSAGDAILPAASTRTVTIRLFDAPVASDTAVVVTTSDTAVAHAAGSVIVRAGTTDATLPLETGIAGEALLTLRTGDVGRELRVIVGVPAADRRPLVIAAPLGIAVIPLPSAGDVVLPAGEARTLRLRLLDSPASEALAIQVVSSDPAVADIAGSVFVPAGSTEVELPIETGLAGEATLTLRSGGFGRELHVIVGTPPPARRPAIVAPPLGIVVLEDGFAGTLFVDPGKSRTIHLRLFPFPSLLDLPVAATSDDPLVATVLPAQQTLLTGQEQITLTLTATAPLPAETRVVLRFGPELQTLRVVVGRSDPARAPTTIASPLGVEVAP